MLEHPVVEAAVTECEITELLKGYERTLYWWHYEVTKCGDAVRVGHPKPQMRHPYYGFEQPKTWKGRKRYAEERVIELEERIGYWKSKLWEAHR